jgi:hypothetical protein
MGAVGELSIAPIRSLPATDRALAALPDAERSDNFDSKSRV